MSWSKNYIQRTVSIAVCMLWVAFVINAQTNNCSFTAFKHLQLSHKRAKFEVTDGWYFTVVGPLGLDNNCLLCLLEQCILGCLQQRSNVEHYLDQLYSALITEENCFINGRQVWFNRYAYMFVKERMCVVFVSACMCDLVITSECCDEVLHLCCIQFMYKF